MAEHQLLPHNLLGECDLSQSQEQCDVCVLRVGQIWVPDMETRGGCVPRRGAGGGGWRPPMRPSEAWLGCRQCLPGMLGYQGQSCSCPPMHGLGITGRMQNETPRGASRSSGENPREAGWSPTCPRRQLADI